MIGTASAGTRFTTRVRDDNIWAFSSLSLILSWSRLLLAIQYTISTAFMGRQMKVAARGVWFTAIVFWTTSLIYGVVSSLPLSMLCGGLN